MRFSLHYRGPLRANAKPAPKHELRKKFHRQLATLWKQRPLSISKLLDTSPDPSEFSSVRPIPPFAFVPLATEQLSVTVELQLLVLRPEPPGRLLTQGGDIDNRLKTLFDSLTMPRHAEQLPPGAAPEADEVPFFFCLLEDDNLVSSVDVRVDQLLEPGVDPNDVDLTIRVEVRPFAKTWGNSIF